MKLGVVVPFVLVLLVGACAKAQPSVAGSSVSACAEPIAAVQAIAERLKTDAPYSSAARSDAGALYNVVIDHPACFGSDVVGQAKQALPELNQPQSNVDSRSLFDKWATNHSNP